MCGPMITTTLTRPLYDCLTAGYLLGAGDPYARYYTATSYTELIKSRKAP